METILSIQLVLAVMFIVVLAIFNLGQYKRILKLEKWKEGSNDDWNRSIDALAQYTTLFDGWRRNTIPETIDCADCGCMVKKKLAVKGDPYVAHGDVRIAIELEGVANAIVFPYYCKRCDPKKEDAAESVDVEIQKVIDKYAHQVDEYPDMMGEVFASLRKIVKRLKAERKTK